MWIALLKKEKKLHSLPRQYATNLNLLFLQHFISQNILLFGGGLTASSGLSVVEKVTVLPGVLAISDA